MIGVGGFLVIFPVARIAVNRGVLEILVLMTILAAQCLMGGIEGHSGIQPVTPSHVGPVGRPMAFFASAPEPCPVEVVLAADPMTIIAAVRCPLDRSIQMTGNTGDGEMAAFQRENSAFMEPPGNIAPSRGCMAGLAVLQHGSLMRVRMTELAIRFVGHVRARLVAFGAIFGQRGMFSLEGKSSFRAMVESLDIQRPDIGVDAAVFLVAGLAISADLAVNTLFCRDLSGNGSMAGQAFIRAYVFVLGMALLAVRLALKRAVRFGERTWRGALSLPASSGKGNKSKNNEDSGTENKAG